MSDHFSRMFPRLRRISQRSFVVRLRGEGYMFAVLMRPARCGVAPKSLKDFTLGIARDAS